MSALKRLAALSCVGLIATTTACGSAKSTGPVAGVPSVIIKVGSANPYSTLDPAQAYDVGAWAVFYNVYQSLLSYPPGGNTAEFDAAQTCSFTDPETYKCTLRPNLKFSNGDPLNADAVKFSIDRVLKIDDPNGAVSILSTIKSVETSGSDGVIFHLKSADATLPDKLTSGVASIVDPKVFSATKEAATDFTGIVGSGRYKIDSVTFTGSGSSKTPSEVKLSLNPNYQGNPQFQGTAGTARNSGIDLKYYASQADAKTALDNKDVDVVIQDLNASDIVNMQASQQLGTGLQVSNGPGGTVRVMSLNTVSGPLSNPAVRRAIAALIDRNAIANTDFQHTVAPAYTIVPSSITNATASFANLYGRNPESASKVRTELEGAGVSLPVKFTLSYGKGDSAKEKEVAMIKQQLEQSGLFQVTLKGYASYTAMQNAVLKTHNFDAFMVAWSADYQDIDDFINPLVGPNNALYNGWRGGDAQNVASLITNGLTVTPRVNAAQTYKKIQNYVAKDVPVIPIWENNQFAASQSDITGVPLTLDSSGIARWWMIGKTDS
ncbi:ABC transporter substrate-binding protein [Streptacidiphilus melanogenes]|uniref:ABC transporter substrate-binding protein n=1 Tax=Streptacidiphilus melanogenes TaxID=411235 RepID=UPI0005A9D9F0|nr:ABC transporter substrate-binding protein [Streptacidiphilus melanogenes]